MSKQCKASNPATCPYHGSPASLERSVAKGDINSYLSQREELDSNEKSGKMNALEPMKNHDPLERRDTNQLDSKGEKIDRADAKAIYEVYKGLQSVRCASTSYVHRAAREAIQKIWQEPRMPSLKTSHNKPLAYPWSPKARDLILSGKATKGALVLEHTTPISILRDKIFDEVSKEDCTEETIYNLLKKEHEELSFVILTKAEDTKLGKKFRNSLSSRESAYGRYEEALGLTETDFISATKDDRYPQWIANQEKIKEEEKAKKAKARREKRELKKKLSAA